MKPVWRRFWVGALLVAAAATVIATQWSVTTDVAELIPTADSDSAAQLATAALSRELAKSELSRTMILTVGGADDVVAAARTLEAALRAEPRVGPHLAFLEGGARAGIDDAIWQLYQPRRLAFAATSVADAGTLVSTAGLTDAIADLKRRLRSPLSALVSRVAPSDPLLALPRLFDRLQADRAGGLTLRDGRFVTEDGKHAVLLLATRAAAFDGAVQGPLVDAINERFEQDVRAHHPAATLESSGINRFAVAAERVIKRDIQTVSVIGIIGLLVICLVLFRSLVLAVLVTVPLVAGTAFGLACTLLVFGRVHGLTLAFGASLMGVAIDYVVHLYCHHAWAPVRRHGASAAEPLDPSATLRHVRAGLILGALTTVAGFVALGWSGFPGLAEVALFASTGIVGALLATLLMVPGLTPSRIRPGPGLSGLAGACRAVFRVVGAGDARGKRIAAAVALVALVVCAIGWQQIVWDDELADFRAIDGEMFDEDARVRARVARFEQSRVIVALGASDEEALQANDAVADQLKGAVEAGELGGFRSAAMLLPSAKRQAAVSETVRSSEALWTRLTATLTAAGFVPGAFEPFRRSLAEPPSPPLTYRELAASPLEPLVRSFRVQLDGQVGILTFLRGLHDVEGVSARVAQVGAARFVDQGALMAKANRAYRQSTTVALLVGLVVVFLVLLVRYRGARLSLAAFIPAVAAAGLTVAVLALVGQPLNLLSLTALLMVCSIGVDYGVFVCEAHKRGDEATMTATLMSLVVACLSTVFGFGLLALAEHPALRSIGLTAAVGVVCALTLAPLALVVAGQRPLEAS